MRKAIILTLAVLCLALQPMSAQKNQGNDYKYQKAMEILDEGGDRAQATELLKENIKENPKHIQSYMVLVGIYRRDGDYAYAMRMLNTAMQNNYKGSNVSEATMLWWKAYVYDDMDDSQNAVDYMEMAVKKGKKQNPDTYPQMLESMAQFYYSNKQYDESDHIYRSILKADDSELLPRVGLARNMSARGDYDGALAILDECAKYDSEYYEIYRFKMQAYQGKKEYKKMIDAMVTLYEMSDDSDYLDVDKFKMDRKYSFAVIKQKIAGESDNALWRYVLSSLYQECHMYAEAIPLLNGLMEEYGLDEDLLEERANCYDEMGMTDMAIADMTTALEICNPKNVPYYSSARSGIYRGAGMFQEAIDDITVYIDRFPTRAYGYYARGLSKQLAGDLAGAMEDYTDGIDVDEEFAYIYLTRGKLHLKNGNKELAEEDFQKVVALDSAMNVDARYYALHFLGRDEEAAEIMDKIIEADPYAPGEWYNKACLYSLMGRLDEAVEALKTSFEKGYRSLVHIEHDDDLDPLRDREDFKALIEKYTEILESETAKFRKEESEEGDKVVTEVEMKKTYGGTYEVACSVNGLPLKMIFDTGAGDVTISAVEANFMLKNGYLSEEDIKGKRNYMTASGDIHEGTVIRLKEVKLGDAVLKNVEASVVHSQKAPLLLGQSVLDKFGTVTIDYVNSKLVIKQ